ncbi:MAG: hypothetical protein JW990_17210 [Thermoleophilia bacterium]|nr:hypothetical protein [Thermoleophilia bacterium]
MMRNLVGLGLPDTGQGRSSNGASSFHLAWQMPRQAQAARLAEVSAVFEVQVPPDIQALYFWALQVDLADPEGVWGGAHTGLQWNPRYPDGTAVNWGGYFSTDRIGAVLPGTTSPLRGYPDDPNTLAYHWSPGRPYRLRVFASPEVPGAWRAEVIDLQSGAASTIRDLLPPPGRPTSGSYLTRPVVWSEVFADCGAPSVTVRWSELQALDAVGDPVRPDAVLVNYQTLEAGGCPNTTVVQDEAGGFLQVTNVPRLTKQGAALPLPADAQSAHGARATRYEVEQQGPG